MPALLDVDNLRVHFRTDEGVVQAVRDVSLQIQEGETLALVGESGCGKSVAAMSAMRLVPTPPGEYVSGSIHFDGRDVFSLSKSELQDLRGNDIAMIFQEPMTSLNPLLTVGDQIMEAVCLHQNKSSRDARKITLDVLQQVAIPSPEERIDQYPHEMSGGMKQRIMIAMAISCKPKLLIADEPTTALDVTTQSQILNLLDDLRQSTGMAILLITHNLGLVAEYADRVAVMYSGKIVEEAPVETLFEFPAHPYTRGLLNSIPQDKAGGTLQSIPGEPPNPANLPPGCAFFPRCQWSKPAFEEKLPPQFSVPDSHPDHKVACWLYEKGARPDFKS